MNSIERRNACQSKMSPITQGSLQTKIYKKVYLMKILPTLPGTWYKSRRHKQIGVWSSQYEVIRFDSSMTSLGSTAAPICCCCKGRYCARTSSIPVIFVDINGQSAVPPLCSSLLLHNQESFYISLLSYEKFYFTSTFNFLSHFFHFIFSEIHTCTRVSQIWKILEFQNSVSPT